MDIDILHNLENKARFADVLDSLDMQNAPLTNDKLIIKSRIHYQMGNRSDAHTILVNLLKDIPDMDSEETILEILLLKIEYLIETREINQIEEYITQVLEIISSSNRSKTLQNSLQMGKFLYHMGNFHAIKSAHTEALDTYLKSMSIFKQLKSSRYEALVNCRIGTVHLMRSDYKKATRYLKSALKINQTIPNMYDEADILNRLGVVYLRMTNLDNAEKCIKKSIKYYELYQNLYGLQKSYTNLGTILRRKGEYSKAVEQLKKGIEIATKLDDIEILFGNYINVGNIFLDNGDLDMAQTWFMKSLNFVDQIQNKRTIAILYSNLGLIYQKNGLFSTSLKYFENSMEISKQINNEQGIIKAYHNIGIIYRLQGQPTKALPYFEYSLKLRKNKQDLEGMAWDLQYIGMIKFELAKYHEAQQMFEQCYEIRSKIANKIQLSEILFLAISVYVILGQEKMVHQRFDELSEIRDTIDSSIVQNHFMLSEIKVKQSSMIRNKVFANEIYKEILSRNVVDIEHTQEAEIGHCDFLLLEYKYSNDENTLVELRTLIADLYDKAKLQENYRLLVEILVIEAKLSALTNDYELAYNFILHASDISENKNMVKQKIEISLLRETFEIEMPKGQMNTLMTNSISKPKGNEIDSYIEILAANFLYDIESADLFPYDEKEIIISNLKLVNLIQKDKNLPPETNDALHFLELSFWDYRLLINSYYLLHRIESNSYYGHPENTEINALLRERIIVFKQKQISKRINIIEEQNKDRIVLEIDKNLLVLIFDNLLQNTMKFTPDGGLVVINFNKVEGKTVLEFRNDCNQIPEWMIDKLFEKYVQWQFNERVRKLGIGIGLTFIGSAIKYMGGIIEIIRVGNEDEFGLRIRISLPESMFQPLTSFNS